MAGRYWMDDLGAANALPGFWKLTELSVIRLLSYAEGAVTITISQNFTVLP